MARTNFNDGQEVVYEDLNKVTSRIERLMYDRVVYEMLQRTSDRFFADSMLVNYVSPSSVSANAGLGFQLDNTQPSEEPIRRPIFRSSATTLNITPADPADDRIDVVCVKAAIVDGGTEARKFKAAISGTITTENLVTTKEWEAEFLIVDGTPDPSPVAPSVPAGYIKLAELYVNAVVGLSGSGDVTDFRSLMPVGGSATINSLSFDRLTQSATLAIQQALEEVDAYIKNGLSEYLDFEDLVSDPAAPGVGLKRVYFKGDAAFFRNNGGTVTPLGSGGGGGGGLVWTPVSGSAPIETEEFEQNVYLYETGAGQKLVAFVKVPEGYLAGRQIKLYAGIYSPSASNTILLKADASLIRVDTDAIDVPAGTHASTNTALTNTLANMARVAEIDLTTALGLIAGFSVQPGDIIKIELERGTDTDTADIRFIPSSTELKFS